MHQRVFAARAMSLVDSRDFTSRALDELHAWGEERGMTEADEENALRRAQLSWAALEALEGLHTFLDSLYAQSPSAVVGDGGGGGSANTHTEEDLVLLDAIAKTPVVMKWLVALSYPLLALRRKYSTELPNTLPVVSTERI
jgi:hypothetical protein